VRSSENKEGAAGLHVDQGTVGKWRRRFVERRIDGLHDEPRSGTPRTIDDARIEGVVVKTLESLPADATHWSSRGMAKASGISVSSVQRIWRAFGLQPHRMENFKLSTDPDFVAKVRDVVGLYAARQGVTGHNVRYVLAISLGAAVVILAILWFVFFVR
jgi:transposase